MSDKCECGQCDEVPNKHLKMPSSHDHGNCELCNYLESRNAKLEACLERGIELDEHPQSCLWFCDKNQPCDCFISIAKAALEEK